MCCRVRLSRYFFAKPKSIRNNWRRGREDTIVFAPDRPQNRNDSTLHHGSKVKLEDLFVAVKHQSPLEVIRAVIRARNATTQSVPTSWTNHRPWTLGRQMSSSGDRFSPNSWTNERGTMKSWEGAVKAQETWYTLHGPSTVTSLQLHRLWWNHQGSYGRSVSPHTARQPLSLTVWCLVTRDG